MGYSRLGRLLTREGPFRDKDAKSCKTKMEKKRR